MPDPIRDLENLPVTPVQPLPAAEVRRRGDRMRRRRTFVGTGLAAAAVVAVASLGVAIGGLGGGDEPTPVPSGPAAEPVPTTPDPVPEPSDLAPVTTDHLLGDADLDPLAGTGWSVGQTYPGGSEPAFSCDPGLAGFDAHLAPQLQMQVWQKVWHIEGTITLQQTIASFDTAQAAEKVASEARDALEKCDRPLVTDYLSSLRLPHIVDANQAFVVDATWRDDVEEGGEAFAEHRSIVGVVRVGNRVSILSLDAPVGTRGLDTGGPDSPDGGLDTPVDTMMEKVVERLGATP